MKPIDLLNSNIIVHGSKNNNNNHEQTNHNEISDMNIFLPIMMLSVLIAIFVLYILNRYSNKMEEKEK